MNSYFHLLSKESLINLNQTKIMEMYEIGDQLGKGAQGVVYKAARRSDRRSIALKVVDLNNVDARPLLRGSPTL